MSGILSQRVRRYVVEQASSVSTRTSDKKSVIKQHERIYVPCAPQKFLESVMRIGEVQVAGQASLPFLRTALRSADSNAASLNSPRNSMPTWHAAPIATQLQKYATRTQTRLCRDTDAIYKKFSGRSENMKERSSPERTWTCPCRWWEHWWNKHQCSNVIDSLWKFFESHMFRPWLELSAVASLNHQQAY
jgi:hypothetical protein